MRKSSDSIPEHESTLIVVDFVNGQTMKIENVVKRSVNNHSISFWTKHEDKIVIYTQNVLSITYYPG